MRKALLSILILALTVTAADARRRGHRHHGGHRLYPMEMASTWQRPLPAERYTTGQSRERSSISNPVPPDWRLRPPDPNWHGRRYLSPDGQSWLAAYARLARRTGRCSPRT
jgi:hypothetical protein